MLWHIIAFSTVFALFILQQIQINRMNKKILSNDEITDKIRQVALMYLRNGIQYQREENYKKLEQEL